MTIFKTGQLSEVEKANVMEVMRGTFPPEFINRIDGKYISLSSTHTMTFIKFTETIIFNRLSEQNMGSIVNIRLKEINKMVDEKHKLSLHVPEDVKRWLGKVSIAE